jgi:hypothetical protein
VTTATPGTRTARETRTTATTSAATRTSGTARTALTLMRATPLALLFATRIALPRTFVFAAV